MKSMSMSAHGSSTLAWVCRCSSGLRSASSPPIHILAGEKVCIQAITPVHESSALASSRTRRMAPASVSTGFHTTSYGMSGALSSCLAISVDCACTWARMSSPYRPWLPVRNQIRDMYASSALAVDVLVAVVQPVDVRSGDRQRVAQFAGQVRGAGDVLAHHDRLDRHPGVA